MVGRVGTPGAGSVPTGPQETESTSKPKDPETESSNQTTSNQSAKGAVENATARSADTSLTGKLVASQLQAQLATEKAGAPAAAKITEKPLLSQGKTGGDVIDMQRQLNEFRTKNGLPPIKQDGIFGKETKTAVEQFQEANGLKKDGIIGGNTRDRLTLENNEGFQKLNPDSQEEIRGKMNDSQKDPATRQALLVVGTDPDFAKLSRVDQHDQLQDPKGLANNIADKNLKTLQGMSNDQVLKLAETPDGQKQIAGMKTSLEMGQMTPAKQKELDRLNAATFKDLDGLKFSKDVSEADKASYLKLVRREMMTSPTFAKTMNEINNDPKHPVTVNVGRDMKDVRLDVDRGKGNQDIDLADFDKLPVTPDPKNPDGITQGEVLSHAMREARQRALGANHDGAHKAAIIEENKYRKEIGQTSTRKLPPKDETFSQNDKGDISIIIHFNGAKDEELKFDDKQKLVR